jgi:hypothetical protein
MDYLEVHLGWASRDMKYDVLDNERVDGRSG